MPIKIDFLANVRDLIRGTDDVEAALDDVADSLDDTVAAAKDGKAERAVDDLSDSFRDAAQRAKDLGDAGEKAGRDVDDGMKQAERGVDEFKSEAEQTAKEAAASFDGSFESIGDVAQEVAANAFSGFGPAGTTAGIAVAAGAGVMIDHIEKVGEAFDEAKESAFEMASSVGGALDAAGYAQRLNEWTTNTEKWKQATDIATVTGWEVTDVVSALAAGGSEMDALTDAFNENASQSTVTYGRIGELEAAIRGTTEGYAQGTEAAKVNALALGAFARETGTATGEVDDLGNAIYLLPDQTQVVVNAKTGEAYENVDQFEQNVNGLKDKTVTATLKANTGGATGAINEWFRRNNGKTATVYYKAVGRPGTKKFP